MSYRKRVSVGLTLVGSLWHCCMLLEVTVWLIGVAADFIRCGPHVGLSTVPFRIICLCHGTMHIYPSSAQVPVLKVKFDRWRPCSSADEKKVQWTCIFLIAAATWNRLPCSVHNSMSVKFQDGSDDISVHCQYLTVLFTLSLCCCIQHP